jgi:hypothetical protein
MVAYVFSKRTPQKNQVFCGVRSFLLATSWECTNPSLVIFAKQMRTVRNGTKASSDIAFWSVFQCVWRVQTSMVLVSWTTTIPLPTTTLTQATTTTTTTTPITTSHNTTCTCCSRLTQMPFVHQHTKDTIRHFTKSFKHVIFYCVQLYSSD